MRTAIATAAARPIPSGSLLRRVMRRYDAIACVATCDLPRRGGKSRDKVEDDMAGRVQGKKVFITGGAQGLGAAMARALAAEGAKVALADINFVGAEKTASELNAAHGAGTAFGYELDVTDEGQ